MTVGRSRCSVLLLALATTIAIILVWSSVHDISDNYGLMGLGWHDLDRNRQHRKLLDLSCWVAGKPPGCNVPPSGGQNPNPTPTPPPTRMKDLDLTCWKQNLPPGCDTPKPTSKPTPSLRPVSSAPAAAPQPTLPPVNYLFSAVRIEDWQSRGYCTNTIAEINGVAAYDTKQGCCQDLANGSNNVFYRMCMAIEPVQFDDCTGLNKVECKGSPSCEYNHYQDKCYMMCEGRDENHCRSRSECRYLPEANFCSLEEIQYQKLTCTQQGSKESCKEKSGCDWNHYAKNKQGQCQSACGQLETESACNAIGGCNWSKGRCNFDILSDGETNAPTSATSPGPTTPSPRPSPTGQTPSTSGYCANIRRQDQCKANLPRCKWVKNKDKCEFACETKTKKSECNTRLCTWGKNKCLPKYEDYCDGLSEKRCGEPLQCEWENKKCMTRCQANNKRDCNRKSTCKWDNLAALCKYNHDRKKRKKASDRFAKGKLFNR